MIGDGQFRFINSRTARELKRLGLARVISYAPFVLFERFTAELVIIVGEIRILGDVAYDYGWHDLMLTPKEGGPAVRRKDRYVDIWRKNKNGSWKLWLYMDNQDVADPFQPEEIPSFGAQAQGSF